MPSLTVENYVKAIYQHTQGPSTSVSTGQLATVLHVSPGTVTSMLKTLSESSLVTYTPYSGVALTAAGTALALRVIRRHRLIEVFLSRTLDMSWDEVHEEAEHMEHAVSDLLIDRIDKYLGYPTVDPHGDPIPGADGTIQTATLPHLAELAVGQQFKIKRVLDQTPEFLRFLSTNGLALEQLGQVVSCLPEAGLLQVLVNQRQIPLGLPAASRILVEVCSQ
jgi:DtxR family transcriptional regulator, Mn-dependent transcriptional regulator